MGPRQLHRQHVACEAASTALCVNPRASPSSKVAAASVALFRAAGPRDCLTARVGTAARARAPAAAAQSRRRIASCVFAYTEYDIVSIAIAPSAVMTQARSADIAVWPVRRADRFIGFRVAQGASGW
jgi:hypothetical protein